MRLKIIPVFQFLIAVVAVVGIIKLVPDLNFTFPFQEVIPYFISGLAFLILALSLMSFQQAGTTVDPANPNNASNLVTSGVYKYTRNPMYLAMLLLLIGFVVKQGNPVGLLPVIGFVASMTAWQIIPEEDSLTETFGQEYLDFKSRVRRWI